MAEVHIQALNHVHLPTDRRHRPAENQMIAYSGANQGFDRQSNTLPLYWPESQNYSSQLMSILRAAQEGASTISECLATANRIIPDDDESWYLAWVRTADANKARADLAGQQGHFETAKSSLLRASNYYRAAEIFLSNDDPRREGLFEKMEHCSGLYLKHLRPEGEIVHIPCSGETVMSCYFLPPPGAQSKTPAVICFGGPEVFKDELLHKMSGYALARGLSLLLVDLPGHGVTGLRHPSVSKRDMEVPVGRCFDYLLTRADVDASRVVLYGYGFGSTYATQAASIDDRFAAAVCDGGIWDKSKKKCFVDWMSGANGDVGYAQSLHFPLARKMKCPFLVVAGDCEFLEVEDAIRLRDYCVELGIEMDLAILATEQSERMVPTVIGSDILGKELIFDWIKTKVRRGTSSDADAA